MLMLMPVPNADADAEGNSLESEGGFSITSLCTYWLIGHGLVIQYHDTISPVARIDFWACKAGKAAHCNVRTRGGYVSVLLPGADFALKHAMLVAYPSIVATKWLCPRLP